MQATTTIPIVVALAEDLVAAGIVESLTRPGGNIMGQNLRDPELAGKRLALLKEAVPTINHVAVLVHAADRSHDRVPDHIAPEARGLSGCGCSASQWTTPAHSTPRSGRSPPAAPMR
jgi:putative ABC transport system substrate-binding protein